MTSDLYQMNEVVSQYAGATQANKPRACHYDIATMINADQALFMEYEK